MADSHGIHRTIARNHRAEVLDLLDAHPEGLTDFEIAERLNMYLSSVNATRNSLYNKGLVDHNGNFRPSGRGGTAKVWALAKKEMAHV